MKRILTITAIMLLFVLASCTTSEQPTTYNLNTYTEQELIDLIETLLPKSYQRVDYDLKTFQEAIITMSEQNRDAVIGIQVYEQPFSSPKTGSGVIYKKDLGTYYVVTNHHVIEAAQNIEVVYERQGLLFTIPQSDIRIIGSDATTDLAVITFQSTRNFNTAVFADSYETRIGQIVFAMGNPLGFNYYGTLTMGVISGLSRYVSSSDLEVPFIQHDASISPGNSGGALFDINGHLIGINNMKIINDLASNIGFAIPSNTVYRIIQDLETYGTVRRPYLGVSAMLQVSDCNQEFGVCIHVQSGGAAEEALLNNRDIIIGYKIDSWPVYIDINNFNDLREAILNSQVGDRVSLRFIRDETVYESPYAILKLHPSDQ